MGLQITPLHPKTEGDTVSTKTRPHDIILLSCSEIVPPKNLSSPSTNLLLSQCSSLASLPSLGLNFTGPDHPSKLPGLQAVADCVCIATLKNLGDQVASPDESSFYTASSISAASLKAWPSHGTGIYSSFGPKKEGAVRALVVAGDRLFSSHDDYKIRVWARPDRRTFDKKGKLLLSCTPASAGGGSGTEEAHKLVAALPTAWDCMTRSVVPSSYVQVRRHHKQLWIQHSDAISALAMDPKEDCLYSASWDRSVKVWRLRDFKCVESFRAHDDAINTLAVSPLDGFLYTASSDAKVKVWARQTITTSDLSSNAAQAGTRRRRQHCLVATLEGHRSAVNALAFSSDGSLLYSGACDKAIVVWERENSAQHASLAGALRGHRHAVLSLAAWGHTLCSGSADKTIRVWHRLEGRLHACIALLEGHLAPIKSLSLSARCASAGVEEENTDVDLSLYSASLDHDIKTWKLGITIST